MQHRSGSGDTVPMVVASHDLPAGIVLTADDVKVENWPSGAALPASFSKIDDVLKHPLLYPVGEKQPIFGPDLAEEGSGLGLSAKIPEGMRATSVRSNEVVGVAGFLYPGSHVDVLATFSVSGSANSVTQTILQDVEVLTAGEKIEPDPQGKPQTVNVVTLLLNAEDSQKLLLASTQGTIQFVLRNSADAKKMTVLPTALNQLVPVSSPAPKVGNEPAKRPAPVASDDNDGVEVIRGDARTVDKF